MMEEFIVEITKINYKIMKIDCVCVCCVRRIEKRIVVMLFAPDPKEKLSILTPGYIDRTRTNNIRVCGPDTASVDCNIWDSENASAMWTRYYIET